MKLEFINSNSSANLDRVDHKRIKSHVLRARIRRGKQIAAQRPWINSDLPYLPRVGPMSGLIPNQHLNKVPRPICPDLATAKFPHDVDARELRDMYRFLTTVKSGFSPFESCIQAQPEDDLTLLCVLEDPLHFQLMLFQVRNHVDSHLETGGPTYSTSKYLGELLRLLQKRLSSIHTGTSDSTIMAVCSLIMSAHDKGDEFVAMKHMTGLQKIIDLRGGVRSMTHNNHRLQRKVCRVDLSVALRFNSTPLLFHHDELDWQPYIIHKLPIRRSHHITDNSDTNSRGSFLTTYLEQCVDPFLHNIYTDLQTFSHLADLAHQADKTLDSSFVNEVIISTFYRLLHFNSSCSLFHKNTANELLRQGLLAYSVTVFLQDQINSGRYAYVAAELDRAITSCSSSSLHRAGDFKTMPEPLKVWLTLLPSLLSSSSSPTAKGEDVHLSKILSAQFSGEKTVGTLSRGWLEVRSLMKAVMWIGFVHDARGQAVVEAVMAEVKS